MAIRQSGLCLNQCLQEPMKTRECMNKGVEEQCYHKPYSKYKRFCPGPLSTKPSPLRAKPIHHQENQCLKLKVTVNGKITHSPQAHANSQEKRLPADDPEVQVLHSIGQSAAPRLFPLVWAVLLLPLLLLQTQ
ncbi:ephrin-A1-like protein [Cricetulus griseus]|nr:ephrin-A1-like protein [Cricetulus griseus]